MGVLCEFVCVRANVLESLSYAARRKRGCCECRRTALALPTLATNDGNKTDGGL